MSDDDRNKEMLEWLKRNHVKALTESDEEYQTRVKEMMKTATPLVTVEVVRPPAGSGVDGSVGMHIKWGEEFGSPDKWDKENLTGEQQFCLALMMSLQDLMYNVAAANEEALKRQPKAKPTHLRSVTKDNYQDILDQMEAIDKDQMN